MTNELSYKIENIQKNFAELNNMFELSIISNQSTDLGDFIEKVSDFIHSALGVEDVLFFLPEGEIFTVVNGSTFIELSDNNDGFWKLLQDGELIKFVGDNGETLYKSFIESNGLKKIDTHYLKGFNKDGVLIGICYVGAKTDESHLNEAECRYLEKIFGYIEPVLYKFIKLAQEKEDMRRIYKTLHNVSILYNISQAMNFIDDLKRLLNTILDKALETIDKIAKENNVKKIIIGLPLNMDNSEGTQAEDCREFARRITRYEIIFEDERLTSDTAEENLRNRKINFKKDKGLVDIESACIILEQYLARRKENYGRKTTD